MIEEDASRSEEEAAVCAVDVGELGDWLDGLRPLSELRASYPFFTSDADAQTFLDQTKRGLADIDAGRVHTTEEMMRELERRRRVRRAAA